MTQKPHEFDAVILAGGQSSRMGRDKAGLVVDGRTLLERQIGLARAAGAATVFISGRQGVDYSSFGCRVLQDVFPDAGPLAGIERGLDAMSAKLLLVLAVDLPNMSVQLLRQLHSHCRAGGAIPRVGGELEPLVAFYPKAAHALSVRLLQETSGAVRQLAEMCVRENMAKFVELPESEAAHFANCNTPTDLEGFSQRRECLVKSI